MSKLSPMQSKTLERLQVVPVAEESRMPELDLDAELAALAAEITPEPEEQVIQYPENSMREDILSLLSQHPDAPSGEQILKWKLQHGDDALQVYALDKKNVFIYTHITLGQWEKIQAIHQQIQQGNPQAMQIEKTIREKVIRSAVLWPELPIDFFQKCRAGLPNSLYELIMLQSYFLTPQQAITLTTQL
jgi:hypothetical protein